MPLVCRKIGERIENVNYSMVVTPRSKVFCGSYPCGMREKRFGVRVRSEGKGVMD